MKLFYKINQDGTASAGMGDKVPTGFNEYVKGSEPQELVNALAIKTSKEKWAELDKYLSTLTVQKPASGGSPAGFKFNASPNGILNITQKISVMTDISTALWIEDWGSKTVTKVELQEALVLYDEAKQAKITELFGAV